MKSSPVLFPAQWSLWDSKSIKTNCLFKLYLFYNDYETSYTSYVNHARWYQCLRSGGLRVGENRSAQRKPTCLDLVTTWPSHMPTPGIKPVSQLWEACALTLCQPDSQTDNCLLVCLFQQQPFTDLTSIWECKLCDYTPPWRYIKVVSNTL